MTSEEQQNTTYFSTVAGNVIDFTTTSGNSSSATSLIIGLVVAVVTLIMMAIVFVRFMLFQEVVRTSTQVIQMMSDNQPVHKLKAATRSSSGSTHTRLSSIPEENTTDDSLFLQLETLSISICDDSLKSFGQQTTDSLHLASLYNIESDGESGKNIYIVLSPANSLHVLKESNKESTAVSIESSAEINEEEISNHTASADSIKTSSSVVDDCRNNEGSTS